MTQSPHIIVVDDEAPAREMVGEYLKMHGFTVTLCDGGKSLRNAIDTSVPDLVVLDLNMPEEDGLSIIRDLKSRTNVPVIMLTATASPIDRVVGLELGADDYIAKPCELRELMARIRSVLRRSSPARTPATAPATAKAAKDQLVRFGTKWLDLEAQALRDDEGNEHPLTASEFGLLKVFAANPKRVLSRERLLELANARDSEAFDRAVDLRIMRNPAQDRTRSGQARGYPHHPRWRIFVFAGRREGAIRLNQTFYPRSAAGQFEHGRSLLIGRERTIGPAAGMILDNVRLQRATQFCDGLDHRAGCPFRDSARRGQRCVDFIGLAAFQGALAILEGDFATARGDVDIADPADDGFGRDRQFPSGAGVTVEQACDRCFFTCAQQRRIWSYHRGYRQSGRSGRAHGSCFRRHQAGGCEQK